MKTGLVLEGGAMRGVFTAGALDYLLEWDIHFQYVIGVSAGAMNGMNFVSRQHGRTKRVLTHEDVISYCGKDQLTANHRFLNLETFVKKYALEDFPFDFETFNNSETEFESVVINCETGLPEYHGDYKNQEEFFKFNMATCALPFLANPIEIRGNHYLDGSLTDSIPLKRAIEKGCDKVLIILTKPEEGSATDYKKMKFFIDKIYGKYPKLCEVMCDRMENYASQKAFMDKMEAEGKVMVIRPEKQLIRHYDNNVFRSQQCYEHGRNVMEKHFEKLKEFFEID